MRAKSGPAIVVVMIIALLPAFYVLSTGPVVWLHNRGMVGSESPIWLIDVPLEVAFANWPLFEDALTWYLRFWDPTSF